MRVPEETPSGGPAIRCGTAGSAANVFSLEECLCRSGIASHLPALGVVSGMWAQPMGASNTACLPPPCGTQTEPLGLA